MASLADSVNAALAKTKTTGGTSEAPAVRTVDASALKTSSKSGYPLV